ncbi:xylulokinase [Neptunomonas phycophila]|uniref:xylulokinase n=1 Tax=Neptunomonas phycophila TaxID=1572645 RepID=UPI0023F9C7AF|nr:xylulokinase [Neptunomonas phycophila]
MYVGVDCGTQGTKVVILDTKQQKVRGEGYAPHALISEANGCREQSPYWWTDAFALAYHAAVEQAGIDTRCIRGIGVSGQQHGLVVLDREGQVIRPAKLWCDTQTAPENAELLAMLGGESGSIEQLGLVLATGYTLSKLLWLKKNEPENFANIAHILLPHDYINYWLTGQMATECGDASGTGYFDVRTRQWNTDVLSLISPDGQLADALPPILSGQQSIGRVRKELAQTLGLSDNVIVSSGGGDNMMGAIGTANIEDGMVTMSLGTSGTIYAYSSTAPSRLHPDVASFCSSSNGWLPLICTMNLTSAANKMRETLGLDLEAFNQLIADTPIGAEGLTMLPFLNGERVPALPDATGSLLGLNMQNMTPGHLSRAVVEGTTFTLRYGLDRLRESGVRSETICLIGGGAKSPVWRQLVADVMNTRVVCPVSSEAAALGGAIQAVWCDLHEQGQDVSLAELCSDLVVMNDALLAEPQLDAVQAYEQAYQAYLLAVAAHYPEAEVSDGTA